MYNLFIVYRRIVDTADSWYCVSNTATLVVNFCRYFERWVICIMSSYCKTQHYEHM